MKSASRRLLPSALTRLFAVSWAALCLLLAENVALATTAQSMDEVLVLYDGSGPYGWVGEMNARFLLNLLGHFPQRYHMTPVECYVPGDALRSRATFYFGSDYNNPLPSAFKQDVMATTNAICWFKYNMLQLPTNGTFEAKFGFRFDFMDSSGFPQIEYRGETFLKDQLDAELGRTEIIDPTRARVVAVARQLPDSNSIPYIVQASNFWYVADIPFSYISEEDRYLVFADVLHDILRSDHPETHQALIRLEDVDPTYDTQTLRQVADYLHSEQVPFSVAVIPRYLDPFGYYENGALVDVSMSDAQNFVSALKYMVGRGGQLVMHGYTHQYGTTVNPYSAVSGDDYEFFRVTVENETNIVTYMPIPEDSLLWVRSRLNAGAQEFAAAGLDVAAWETPHYAASALDYSVFATNFPLTFQRVLYFDTAGHVAGQFFPYTIERDVYGQKLMPENLGNVDPIGWQGYPARFPSDMLRAARKNRVLRDAWAGGFFHPYLDLSYLQELISGLKALGFTFVALPDPPPLRIISQPANQAVTNGARVTLAVTALGTEPLRYQWQFNGTNISHATNASFVLASAQPTNSGAYSVTVTNAVASLTSDLARLQVTVAFAITNLSYNAAGCTFSIRTQSGTIYTVQFKESLSDAPWQCLSIITGDGGTIQIADRAARSQRFYRVVVE